MTDTDAVIAYLAAEEEEDWAKVRARTADVESRCSSPPRNDRASGH